MATDQLQSLSQIFKGSYFQIPDYQRGYAWEEKQVQALLDDIKYLMGSQYIHYTGTIVAKKNESFYEIVDGQQRLTTLIIIIHGLLKKVNNKEYEELFVKRGETGNQRFVFQANRDTKDFFHKVIIEDDEKTLSPDISSKKNILNAKKLIQTWIKMYEAECSEILTTIVSRLGFLFYSPNDDNEIGIMFEVINDRGKPLSQLEKIKNYLLYFSIKMNKSNLKDKIISNWPEILKNLSIANKESVEDEDSFLRFCWIVYFDTNKSKSYYVHEGIKAQYPIDDIDDASYIKLEQFIDFMVYASKVYAQFFNKNNLTSGKEVDTILSKLRSQNTYASIMPLYLAIMTKETDDSKRKKLLDMLEILNFRVYILPDITKRTDTGQGELFGLANGYFEDYDKKWEDEWSYDEDGNFLYDNIHDWLLDRMKKFIFEMCPEKDFVEALKLDEDEQIDYYRWGGLRYFLMNYEEFLNQKKTIDIDNILLSRDAKKVNDYYSVEHIWATNNNSERNNRSKDKWQKRRLGNFVLLEMGINIQAQDDDLSKKIDIYKGVNNSQDASQLKQIQEIENIFITCSKNFDARRRGKDYYFDLHQSIFDKREEKMIKFAKMRWNPK